MIVPINLGSLIVKLTLLSNFNSNFSKPLVQKIISDKKSLIIIIFQRLRRWSLESVQRNSSDIEGYRTSSNAAKLIWFSLKISHWSSFWNNFKISKISKHSLALTIMPIQTNDHQLNRHQFHSKHQPDEKSTTTSHKLIRFVDDSSFIY